MHINVSTATGKITNLFMMLLNETISDIFYDQPEIYLKCIKAGAKYLKEEPYPENNQDIKFKYGYHPEKVTNREEWWTNALKPIKAELKDHYGPGFTKKIKGIVWTLADEGNTALENMKQFISTGTCEQYELFLDDVPNNSNAGGLYIDDKEFDEHDHNMIFIDEESWKHFDESKSIKETSQSINPTIPTFLKAAKLAVEGLKHKRGFAGKLKYASVHQAYRGFKACDDALFIELPNITNEYEARNIAREIVDIIDWPESANVDYFVKEYWEISEDRYEDLDPRIRDTQVVCITCDENKTKAENFQFEESYRPICQNCGDPLSKEEVETYGDTCEACALDDIGRDRHYDGPDVGDLFESFIKEGTNTEKKNYIDIKGEKAPLDWDRIDDKIEKVGFGKDLDECVLREDTIKSWYEPFKYFCYQIYNGGISQPLGLNPHYYKDICTLLDELPSGGIMEKIYLEKNIPDEWAPILEKFVKEVCELCDAVSETEFYKDCDWCGGSGEEYITEEDEDGDEYSYYDTCDRCDGTGFLRCSIDNMDNVDDAKLCLSTTVQEYWDDLDDNVLEYCEMFKAIEGGDQ